MKDYQLCVLWKQLSLPSSSDLLLSWCSVAIICAVGNVYALKTHVRNHLSKWTPVSRETHSNLHLCVCLCVLFITALHVLFLTFFLSCVCSSKSMGNGGHGLTMSASRSSFKNMRRAGAPRASLQWTIWPKPLAGPYLGPERGDLIPRTHASRERIRPKISQGVDVTLAFLLKVCRGMCIFNVWNRSPDWLYLRLRLFIILAKAHFSFQDLP